MKTSRLDTKRKYVQNLCLFRAWRLLGGSGGVDPACKNKPSLDSFSWVGHTYSTVQRAGCQSQPGLWLSLRLPGHANHKPLPVTDQDGGSKQLTNSTSTIIVQHM